MVVNDGTWVRCARFGLLWGSAVDPSWSLGGLCRNVSLYNFLRMIFALDLEANDPGGDTG